MLIFLILFEFSLFLNFIVTVIFYKVACIILFITLVSTINLIIKAFHSKHTSMYTKIYINININQTKRN